MKADKQQKDAEALAKDIDIQGGGQPRGQSGPGQSAENGGQGGLPL